MTPGVESIGMDTGDEKNTKSILELDDLTDFLGQAEMANRDFASERERYDCAMCLAWLLSPQSLFLTDYPFLFLRFVVLDSTGTEYIKQSEPRVSFADVPPPKESFVFNELSVPRRPAWDESTTPQELDKREKQAFLEWRRAIAKQEEVLDGKARVTPFEKNLQVWRQLWRVLERCSCIIQIVDARNPLFYLSKDLRNYASVELGKPMLLLVNKSDYLSPQQRHEWHDYLKSEGWDHLFFSAHLEQAKLDAAASVERKHVDTLNDDVLDVENDDDDDDEHEEAETQQDTHNDQATGSTPPQHDHATTNIGIETPLTRQELIDWLKAFAVQNECEPDPRYDDRIQFGMVRSSRKILFRRCHAEV